MNEKYSRFLGRWNISNGDKWKYAFDSVTNTSFDIYDSIYQGKVRIKMFSLLTPDVDFETTLKKPTTIYFDSSEYSAMYFEAPGIFQIPASLSDTMYIGFYSWGCFTTTMQKLTVVKKGDHYIISSTENYGDSISVIRVDAATFEKQIAALKLDHKNPPAREWVDKNGDIIREITFASGGSQILVRIGNRIFSSENQSRSDSIFTDFKTRLGFTLPKQLPAIAF